MNYYNENDPQAAAWLKELIKQGLIPPGEVDERSITDVEATDLRGFIQHHFFAGIGGWGYALQLAGWPEDRPVWTGSCPCFTAGTLILCKRGLVKIEDVVVGDKVWTHKNRWQQVIKIGSDFKQVGQLTGQGHFGIVTTPEHPFYCAQRHIRNTRHLSKSIYKHKITQPTWELAVNMPGKWWAMLKHLPETSLSVIPNIKDLDFKDIMFLAGLYIGDGWMGKGTRKDYIILGVNEEKRNKIINRLPQILFKEYREKTLLRLTLKSKVLSDFLLQHFKNYSANKQIPSWVLGLPQHLKKSFLEGWNLTDGTRKPGTNAIKITTISRQMAISGRMLLVSMGYSVSLRKIYTPDTTKIEGRVVKQKNYYTLTGTQSTKYSFEKENFIWFKAKNYKPLSIQQVFNIEVEHDNSYTADGIVVHNCQSFSTAGKQKGFADERHLWPVWFELIKKCKPDTIFGEQVASAIGHGWLDLVQDNLEEENYSLGAVVLPACSVGAPHLRQRLWFVADRVSRNNNPENFLGNSANNRCHREGQRWQTEERRESEPGFTGKLPERSERSNSTYKLADTNEERLIRGLSRRSNQGREVLNRHPRRSGATDEFWRNCDWLYCKDGKWRSVEPGLEPLVNGVSERVGLLRGYGNAIVPQVATAFIKAFMEIKKENLFKI